MTDLSRPLRTTEAGRGWDAVRMPLADGESLWLRLVSDPETHDRPGPIVLSDRSQATYWLIPAGSSDTWPDKCRLLTRGSHLLLPGPHAHPYSSRWLHQPHSPGRLTGAVWLAAALNDHLALETQLWAPTVCRPSRSRSCVGPGR